jgi:Cof subfamily protein (haloacid dehalogenase superfamily)
MKNVKLISLDMDGTLLASDHWTISQRNIDAIRKAHEAGITVTINTGRMLEDASDFCRRLDMPCMIIAADGTRAADGPLPDGNVFYRRNFESADVHAVLDIVLSSELKINVFEDGKVSTRYGRDRSEYHLVKRNLIHVVYGEKEARAAADRSVIKVYLEGIEGDLSCVEELRKKIRIALPHLQVTNSGPLNIEIVPGNAGKGIALAAMAEYLGLTRENVMAVGDAHNDLSMLAYASHSVAMKNAEEQVKRACRYVTGSNDECGVAQMIERVLESRGM